MRWLASLASVAFALGLASLGACESFSDADAPGAADAANPDVVAIDDASGSETSNDGGSTESCPAGAFCDDFNRSSDPELGWSDKYVGGNAALALVEDTRDPLGHSIAITLAASTGTNGEDRRAFLAKNFPTPAASMRLSFSLRVTLASTGDVLLAQLSVPNGVAFLMLRNGKLAITDQTQNTPDAGGDDEPFVESILGMAWHRVVFTYQARNTNVPDLSVELDGDTSTSAHLDVHFAIGSIGRVEIGSTYAQPGTVSVFAIDDVKMETTF